MVPTEGPKLTPVSNDINSLTVADTRCLGRFWWPVWWPAFFDDDCKAARVSASGSHDGLMRPPVGLRNRWLSKEGTKGGGCWCCCLWFLWMAEFSGGGGGLGELDFGALGGYLSF
jgi:hypothetical protein